VISALRNSAAHVFVDSIDAPVLSDVDAHHLLRVLRVKSQNVVTVSDGGGRWRTCVVDGDANLEATSDVATEAAPKWHLTVAFSVVKGDRPEWTVQKLTEIGVDEIVVLAPTTRSVVRWDAGRANKNLEKLRIVAREAAMQSRRVWLPKVSDVVTLAQLSDAFIADPTGEVLNASHRSIAIGPEGGFTQDEISAGKGVVSLGDTILRAETAAISAAVLMSNYRNKES